jgi:tetratricopeptide (TPR) repeat protein
MGLLQADQQQWDAALGWYDQALAIFVELNQPSNQITLLSNIGDVNRSAKRWNAAQAAYEQALVLSRKLGDRVKEAWRLNELGLLQEDQQQWNAAHNWFEQAIIIFDQLQQPSNQGTVVRNLANIYLEQKSFAQAELLFQQSIQLYQKDGNGPALGTTLDRFAELWQQQLRWDEAYHYYQDAIEQSQQAWGARLRCGLLLIARALPQFAIAYFEFVLNRLPADRVMAQIGLGIAKRYLHDPASVTHFQTAQELLETGSAGRTIAAHYCRGMQLVIDAGFGQWDGIDAGVTALMNDHWPVWDRIDRRTILFALDLLRKPVA